MQTANRPTRHLLTDAILLTALLLSPLYGQRTHRHVPDAVAASRAVGAVDRSARITVAVGLPLRNPVELERFLAELSDPASPNYRHYLTPEEFTARFGPSEQDYQSLIDFMTAHGLEVTGTHPNRIVLDVGGAASEIERAFRIQLLRWRHPQRGEFFAPDREPSFDRGVPVLDIAGLDNYLIPHPMDLHTKPLTRAASVTTGSGPAGLFIGGDFRAAYAPQVTLNGAGQSVGLFELDGFYASDVAANFAQAGLAPVPVSTVLVDGVSGAPGGANAEVTLDIMMAAYMAPGLSSIIVYEGNNWNDVLNRMATDNKAAQLSSSWVFSPTNATTEQIFKQMIAQGQSLFQASGDSGAYSGWIMPPADDPNVTVVGGTSLTTNGKGGPWQSETTWTGSGGGVSTTWPIPSYQQAINTVAVGGSGTMRNIPDVALTADIQMYLVQSNGQAVAIGGTSAAAPLWAGFAALANQQAAGAGKPRIGFLNPALYRIGAGSRLATDLHDIISGNNRGYAALPAWDLATGWGTPAGQPLIDDLTGVSNAAGFSLALSSQAVSIAAGSSGTDTVTIARQNGFAGAVTLSVSGLPTGVTASFNPASATTSSLLTLNVAATAASATSTVTITGTSGGVTTSTRLTLTVTGPPSFKLSAPATVSVTQGASATAAITVTPQNGFTGAVSFAATGLPAGVTDSFAGSVLTLKAATNAALGAATVTITGTSGTLKVTTTLSLTVTGAPSFTLTASPNALSLVPGASGASSITVNPVNGFTGSVAIASSGVPAGVTATLTPAAAGRPAAINFTVGATAAKTTSTITVTGVSGSITAKTTISLTVSAQSFTLAATPAAVSVNPGASASTAIAVHALNGFSGAVAFTASALPSGVSATFNPASSSTQTTLTFAAASAAAPGTTVVTVTGKSGTLVQTVTLSLTVQPPNTVVNLAPYFNVSGVVRDFSTFATGGLDAGGRAYSANFLPTSVTYNGAFFTLGPAAAPDAVSATTIALPAGQYGALKILGAAVNGNQPNQKFVVTYTDGTTAAFTQSISDWCTPQNYSGESAAVPMSYRNNSDGSRDVRSLALYGYTFPLNTAKTVKSVTLPATRNITVLAMSLTH